MVVRNFLTFLWVIFLVTACNAPKQLTSHQQKNAFSWSNATVYFLLTDRFNNGDKSNDFNHSKTPAPYRGFMGGDIKGITQKINDGYFEKLGVDAIWMTPLVENITEGVDEGTGFSYGFHGYWTKDWTKIDTRLGTEKDVKDMVEAAHKKGIRILMDAVINHTGPVTATDIQWPDDWVRTSPKCTYKGYNSTITCTLVDNLPDVKTESTLEVQLPPHLVEKWKKEGRYEKELAELDAFFKRTGYPRRPYYYIIKWLTDLIRKYGIDGFRVDTVKHTEEEVWKTLYEESVNAFDTWKKANPSDLQHNQPFFMVGEVYNYNIGSGRNFDFGDKTVDYFANGFDALINFDFKYDATKPATEFFQKYDQLLNGPLKGKSVMNYVSSHDDGSPFDKLRTKTYESATKLLLAPGIAQIYYGDETGRRLDVQAQGDATLRSYMNWEDTGTSQTKDLLVHWQKLGTFRRKHIAIGAGKHTLIEKDVFSRSYSEGNFVDKVIIAVNQLKGNKSIPVSTIFKDGQKLLDHYSGLASEVKNGSAAVNSAFDIVLLEAIR
ncbi:MAG: alpha-amylase [Saprospiraceae bacterium]|nr:alpha-amylase [Saprospiraceae bacterium]